MSTNYVKDDFSTNDVSGAIAVAVVRDLHVNGHAFRGFPSVSIKDTEGGFEVSLGLDGLTTPTLTLTFAEGKKLAKDFQKKRELDREWMKKVQGMLVELERAYGAKTGR
ncbi:hypothetical protein ABL840_26605 [Variovorax sp. NFACC27]|uniref:hypothetical protein n=1 Tax=unclassified Variovorax TaxID=663243 RepID=UPI00089624E5|nr:hypothetical protein SAMN03159371_03728 [Variovorax sp. NFACC28]SEG78402.1 hypothetical protein SAMN03159365_03807 [Variovorax sp. NFACC29]SFC95211.1 hypothetical protein SAMN03159379_03617 [Variovorax sp. NFACC26]SFG08493.1 hypothetical protein SAMN03159447_01725 [Variovorax sp. NFACC27]